MQMTDGEAIEFLRRIAVPEGPHSGYTVEGYEVRTHPDLVERLRKLGEYAPGSKFVYTFGTPTLRTEGGRVFAIATGSSSLHLRLERNSGWGRPHEELAEPWRQGSAWKMGGPQSRTDEESLAEMVRSAFASAVNYRDS